TLPSLAWGGGATRAGAACVGAVVSRAEQRTGAAARGGRSGQRASDRRAGASESDQDVPRARWLLARQETSARANRRYATHHRSRGEVVVGGHVGHRRSRERATGDAAQ